MVHKMRLIPENVFEKIKSFRYAPPPQCPSLKTNIFNSKLPDDAKLILYQENARNEYQKRLNEENKPTLVKDVSLAKTIDFNKNDLSKVSQSSDSDDETQSELNTTSIQDDDIEEYSKVASKRKVHFEKNEDTMPLEKRSKGRPPKQKRSIFETRIYPDNSPYYSTKYTRVEPHLLVKKKKLAIGSKRNRRTGDVPSNEELWEDYQEKYLQSEPKKSKTAIDLKRKNPFKMTSLKRLQMEANNFVVKSGTQNMNPTLPDADDTYEKSSRKSQRTTKGINRWTPYK